MRVVQVTFEEASELVKMADAGAAELAAASVCAFGQRAWTVADVHVVGTAAPPVTLPGHDWASAKPWL